MNIDGMTTQRDSVQTGSPGSPIFEHAASSQTNFYTCVHATHV